MFTNSLFASDQERVTPDPINPDDIEVEVNFQPDPTDLVLSSVPGGELFDPRKHRFSDEELKPQPMIKKAKKVFVPEEQKVIILSTLCSMISEPYQIINRCLTTKAFINIDHPCDHPCLCNFLHSISQDDKYWQRRNKNNIAAKRSRDARRLKENQITVRAAFLERENVALRQEVAELRKDFGRYKNIVSRYEDKYGPL